jgi:epsilon-lactone hydrolase
MSRKQRQALDEMLRKAPQPFGPVPVEQLRAGFAAFMGSFPVPAGTRSEPGELGGRPTLVVEREEDPRPGTILYFHGGGNVFGSPATSLQLIANLVVRTGFRAVSLDYRLAPEHPFPAGADDALNAYRALLDGGEDPLAIVFAGDSRGGGHSITGCLAARDAGLPMPAAIVAFSPGLDYTGTGKSMDTKAGIDPLFTRESLAHTAAMYLAGQDPAQPMLAPAVYADLSASRRSCSSPAPTSYSSTTLSETRAVMARNQSDRTHLPETEQQHRADPAIPGHGCGHFSRTLIMVPDTSCGPNTRTSAVSSHDQNHRMAQTRLGLRPARHPAALPVDRHRRPSRSRTPPRTAPATSRLPQPAPLDRQLHPDRHLERQGAQP